MKVKMRSGDYMIPVEMNQKGSRISLSFGYAPKLIADVKVLEGAKWHGFDEPPKKEWSIDKCPHNDFQLAYMTYSKSDPATYNPYAPYDMALTPEESHRGRPLYKHQKEMLSHCIIRRLCILACEMGTGKTLVAIELIERAIEVLFPNTTERDIWYVAPKNALESVKADFIDWKCPYRPTFMTYEALIKSTQQWQSGQKAPRVIIFDESSRLKNPTTQRTQAARHVADAMRREYGRECCIILMSGSPAPKSPADWWSQCEVACPGFLKEGSLTKAKMRLSLIKQEESLAGGAYPRLVTWYDDENKCKHCGQYEKKTLKGEVYMGHTADAKMFGVDDAHTFEKSINEVEKLYGRMKGLVLVKFKRDCLDLPPKNIRRIYLKPNKSTLNAAKVISKRASTTIQAMTLLRELSDGFQYKEEAVGVEPCGACEGSGQVIEYYHVAEDGVEMNFKQDEEGVGEFFKESGQLLSRMATCIMCDGKKEVTRFERDTKPVPCPKLDYVKELLELHDDIGRLVIYCGFTASVDRVKDICATQGWTVCRVDGRQWAWFVPSPDKDKPAVQEGRERAEMLNIFRHGQAAHPRVVAVCQADSAGMGLNFSSSPTILLYSATFNAESYIQSIERTHRPGIEKTLAKIAAQQTVRLAALDAMAVELREGAKAKILAPSIDVIQLCHLPSDELVFTNLERKQRLQDITLGNLRSVMDRAIVTEDRS